MALPTGFLARRFFGSLISNATGYAIGGAVTPTLEPYTQSLTNETWQLHPSRPLSPGTAAEAELRGIHVADGGASEAARTGIDSDRYDTLLELAGNPPALDALLELARREAITGAQLDAGLERTGLLPDWRGRVKALMNVLPSVTDMVRFAVREVYSPSQRAALNLDAEFPQSFADDAKRIGLDRDTAGKFWAAHWDLPSYEQGQEMLFRGEISESQFTGLLKALDYAPVWRGPLEAIARRIPTISDMIRFAVREVYNPQLRRSLGIDAEYPTAFTAQAAMHGMSEEHAREYWAAHWRLPSAQQGYRMLWRGEITATQLDELLKALDYPPVWRDRLANIAHVVPGRVDLRRMFRANVITEAEVLAGYKRLGYTDADARTLTDFAVAEKAGGSLSRNETAAELRDEFEGGYATEAEFRAQLSRLGYDAAEVENLVHLGSARAVKTERNRVVTALHKMYVQNKLTDAQAAADLAATGMDGQAVQRIMPLWKLERDANVSNLTAAQVKAAYRANVLTLEQAVAELIERDYSDADARTYLAS